MLTIIWDRGRFSRNVWSMNSCSACTACQHCALSHDTHVSWDESPQHLFSSVCLQGNILLVNCSPHLLAKLIRYKIWIMCVNRSWRARRVRRPYKCNRRELCVLVQPAYAYVLRTRMSCVLVSPACTYGQRTRMPLSLCCKCLWPHIVHHAVLWGAASARSH